MAPKKKKLDKPKRKKKVLKEDEIEVPDYNLPGVKLVKISVRAQKQMDLIIGTHVSAEFPWKFIKKEFLIESIQSQREPSPFIPYQELIEQYPEDSMLLGYNEAGSEEEDEFFFCTTIEVKNEVLEIHDRVTKAKENRLNKSLYRNIRPWKAMGSEREVRELNENQKFRALYEVEINIRFPVLLTETKFRNRDVKDVRDGYVEILPGRRVYETIQKSRIDCVAQAGLPKIDLAIQTDNLLPVNAWTQYIYEYEIDDKPPPPLAKGEKPKKTPLELFLSTDRLEPIYDQLIYNSCLNLYENDYPSLLQHKYYTDLGEIAIFKEYQSFADVGVSQDKLVGCACWHPMWSGIVAIAYVDAADCSILSSRQTRDEVYRAVHGSNPVLLWSVNDCLSPKIIMDAPREVRSISFCPFDENILVGGCVNGQIVLWDITNRLSSVESTEILTTAQTKYRNIVSYMMRWFKNIKNNALLRATAVSALDLCHTDPVTEIQWIHPRHKMGKNGRFEVLDDDAPLSYQFMTSSLDGTILVWDMKMTQTGTQMEKAGRVSRRLGRRLSMLLVDESPYKSLDRFWTPIYRLVANNEGKVNLPITSFCYQKPVITYEPIEPIPVENRHIKTRVIYRPIIGKSEPPEMKVCIGTSTGELGFSVWEGYSFDGGAILNSEVLKFSSIKMMHEGPIACVAQSHFFPDLFLVVGGKIVTIWTSSYINFPLVVLRNRVRLTCCSWSYYRMSAFHIGREDGTIEVWDFLNRNDQPSLSQSISGKLLTGIYTHNLPLNNSVMGIADYRGTFRMFYFPSNYQTAPTEGINHIKNIFDRQIERKEKILVWENRWKLQNKAYLEEIAEKENQRLILKQINIERQQKLLEDQQRKKAEEERRRIAAEKKPEPGKYSEWAHRRFLKVQEHHMHNVLLKKKKLNHADLVKHLAPLRKIAEQVKKKKVKQEKILSMKEKIYQDAVTVSFPETLKTDEGLDSRLSILNVQMEAGSKQAAIHFKEYEQIEMDTNEKIKKEPYNYVFSWRSVISQGYERRRALDVGLNLNVSHRDRYNEYKSKVEKIRRESVKRPEVTISVDDDFTPSGGSAASIVSAENV